MKKILILLAVLMCVSANAYAENRKINALTVDYKIELNSNEIPLENSVLNINDRTYLPVRETAELLNLYVVWDEKTQTINISNIGVTAENDNAPVKYDSASVTADVTDFKLKVDGHEKQPENAVAVVNGTSYLPLRELAEMLNFEVDWDGNTETVSIASKNSEKGDYDFLLPFSVENEALEYDLWGYMDIDGNVIVEPKYTYAGDFADGMAIVSDKEECAYDEFERIGQYGYINIEGKEIIPCEYYGFNNFSDGVAAVGKKTTTYYDDNEYTITQYSYINKNGDIVIDGGFYNAGKFDSGYAPVTLLNDDESARNIYIDKKGNIAADFDESHIKEFNNEYAVSDDTLIDTDFNIVLDFNKLQYSPAGEVVNGMICARYKSNDLCGVVDLEGNVIVPFEYYSLYLKEGEPVLAVKKEYNSGGGTVYKYGYIDLNNNIILPFSYSNADHFTNGVAFILKSEDDITRDEDIFKTTQKISIIDKKGNYIKENVNVGFWYYITGNEYSNGIRKYYQGNKLMYVDKNGEVIEPKI